jgi:hypothetical protein
VISYYCPTEPAYAETAVSGDNFAMATAPTQLGNADAVFVMDMVTGRIIGAAYSWQSGTFNQVYTRNLAADFGLTGKGKYVMVSGTANLRSQGAIAPATGAVFVGELTTGRVNMYGFFYENAPLQTRNTELQLIDSFPWRQSVN